MGKLIINII